MSNGIYLHVRLAFSRQAYAVENYREKFFSLFSTMNSTVQSGRDVEIISDQTFGVEDHRYNRIYGTNFARPYGVNNALLLRNLCGNFIVLDTDHDQVYKPARGTLAGHDFVCETANILWALGHPRPFLRTRGGQSKFKCRGYPHIRAHKGGHSFLKRDALWLLLHHRLRLRVVIAQSTV